MEKIQEFSNILFELKLNDIEIGILSALLLTSTSMYLCLFFKSKWKEINKVLLKFKIQVNWKTKHN